MKDLVSVHEDKIADFGIKAFRVVKSCCSSFLLLPKHSEPHLDYSVADPGGGGLGGLQPPLSDP